MKKLRVLLVALFLVGGVVSTINADETLVSKIVTLFRGLTPNQIDDAVAQAKNQLTTKAKQEAKRNDLEKLFDTQIATLRDRGMPEQIVVKIFQDQKGSVLKKASEMAIGDGNIPFLPVIPRTFHSSYDLMVMVRNGGKVGYTYLINPTQISDVVDTPQEPYYIYDVEDGSSTRGKSPKNAEEILKQRQKRSPLTATEVIALATHTDVLSKHYVWAVGSRYDSADKVPNVYLDYGDRPKLNWNWANDSNAKWGSASCGSRY